MPRLVKGPDNVVHSFPDDATDLEISQALDAHPEKPARTWGDLAKDALGAVGGTIGGLAGGPVGAAIGGAAGEGYRQLAEHASEIPGAVADVARNLVAQPAATLRGAGQGAASGALNAGEEGAIQGGMELGGGLVAKGLEKGGTAVYRGYVKPSLSAIGVDKARDIVQTGIKEWLPVSQYGEAKAARLISQINSQVNDALKNSGATVDLTDIANKVRSFAQRVYNKPGAPVTDFDAVMKVADEIDKHPSLGLPAGATPTRIDVPAAQGNEVKQALDKAIGDTGFGVERNAPTEARKVGRYAAREAIEAKVPGVSSLNARESDLIDALGAIKRAAAREENKNSLTGWGTTMVAGGVGAGSYASGHDPTESILAALVTKGLISPTVATNAAITAAKLGQSKYTQYGADALLRTALVLASRQDAANQQKQ